MEDNGPVVYNVALAFLILTWVAVLLRVYVRAWLLKSMGADDHLILVAQCLFTALAVIEIISVSHGLGKHDDSGLVTADDVRMSLKYFYFAELFYIASTNVLKISVGLFLLRICVRKAHIWTIHATMALAVIFALNWFFGVMFQCTPISTVWNESPLSHKCLGPQAVKGITYSASAITTAVDLVFGILPWFIVSDLNMPLRKKLLVALILGLAMIASVATIIRIPAIKGLLTFEDFLFRVTPVLIWSTVEAGIGIIASSIATLRPLLHSILLHVGLTAPSESNAYTIPSYRRSSRQRSRESSYTFAEFGGIVEDLEEGRREPIPSRADEGKEDVVVNPTPKLPSESEEDILGSGRHRRDRRGTRDAPS